MNTLYIVTGTSSGIGKSLVAILIKRSFPVLGISRRSALIQSPHYFHMNWDMRTPLSQSAQQIELVLRGACDKYSPAKIVLINNAGTLGNPGSAVSARSEDAHQTMRVNYLAPLELTLEAIRFCDSRSLPLSVLNVSTGAAVKPIAGWSEYCASKAAFDLWTRCLHLESADSKSQALRVALFYPGVVDTPMQEAIRSLSPERMPDVNKFVEMKTKGSLLSSIAVAEVMAKLVADPSFGSQVSYDVRDFLK